MCEEILIQGGINCKKAAAEEQAAVVTAAGEHGRRTGGKILPAGVMRHLPEDGIQQGARVGGRATPPLTPPPILRMGRGA